MTETTERALQQFITGNANVGTWRRSPDVYQRVLYWLARASWYEAQDFEELQALAVELASAVLAARTQPASATEGGQR